MKKIFKGTLFLLFIFLLSGCIVKDSMENINISTSMYPIEFITNTLYIFLEKHYTFITDWCYLNI